MTRPQTDRGLFVAAVRHLLSEGWNQGDEPPTDRAHGHNWLRRPTDGFFVGWDDQPGAKDSGVAVGPVVDIDEAQLEVDSVRQAVDYLVVARVLPVDLASWTLQPPVGPPLLADRAAEVVRDRPGASLPELCAAVLATYPGNCRPSLLSVRDAVRRAQATQPVGDPGQARRRGPFTHPGTRGYDASHYFGDLCPNGHFDHVVAPAGIR
jgi:hypothetical protein